MAVSFQAKGKWKPNGPGKFVAKIKVEGFPVSVYVTFDTKTGELKEHYRSMTAVLKDDEMPTVGDQIIVTEKPLVGRSKVTKHDL